MLGGRFGAPKLDQRPDDASLFVLHDAFQEIVASPALGPRTADGSHRARRAGTRADGFPDGSVADGVAVANEHGGEDWAQEP